jgi:hypothetical protein
LSDTVTLRAYGPTGTDVPDALYLIRIIDRKEKTAREKLISPIKTAFFF